MNAAHALTPETETATAPRAGLHIVLPAARTLVDETRAESRNALRHLVELLGQPAEWGDELEEAAFARGVTWRLVGTPAAV